MVSSQKKQAKTIPWGVSYVDLIGHYKVPRKRKNDLELWAVILIHPKNVWFKIKDFPGTK
jgi:hypothetical protein